VLSIVEQVGRSHAHVFVSWEMLLTRGTDQDHPLIINGTRQSNTTTTTTTKNGRRMTGIDE